MFRWYVVNTYSGHEKKVQTNLEHRRKSMSQEHAIRARSSSRRRCRSETKDGQKVQVEKRVLPGYVLVQMDANAETVSLVRNTPGVTGFVGMTAAARATHAGAAVAGRGRLDPAHAAAAGAEAKPKARAEFTLGQPVKITSGPLSDFDGEIIEINPEAGKLKVHVSIFERQVPVELKFDEVKKLD